MTEMETTKKFSSESGISTQPRYLVQIAQLRCDHDVGLIGHLGQV